MKWILMGFAAIVAMRFYYVREMLAALVLFSALFGSVAAALALLFILDRAGRAATEFLELRWKEALQHARALYSVSKPRPRMQR
jgi:hypothetical protein